jgi:hypothetical protein
VDGSYHRGVFVPQNLYKSDSLANMVILTSCTASITVNALVTGLIVFKILKVFRDVKGT